MVIDLRARGFIPESQTVSRNDLLAQKSLVEQSLNEARKLLVSWSVETSKRRVDLLMRSRVNCVYETQIERLIESAEYAGTYATRVKILEGKLNRIKTELGL